MHATIKVVLNKHLEQTNIQSSLHRTINELSNENNGINIDSLTQLPSQLCLQDICDFLLSKDNIQSADFEISDINCSQEKKSIFLKNNQQDLAFLYLDIDRIDQINDSFSKDESEILIKAIADRLTGISNNNQNETAVLRIQDSEFAIVLFALDLRQATANLARTIIESLHQPTVIYEREIFLTASLGIAFYSANDSKIELSLGQAKQAIKYARQQGGNQYKFYSAALNMMPSTVSEDLALETELHYALKRQELELFYQPKVSLKTGKIVGAEALIRWNHPKQGLISPNRFIPLAEASSLIESIGEWVLKEACTQTKTWQQAGFDNFKIAVNLSGRQFKQLDSFHRLTEILFESTLEPKFLELELTEKILVDNLKANVQRLNLTKNLGIQISLDDFGTGYSSLSYLQQFPFDILKIDRCFVSNIDLNPTNAVIVKTIISMAHELNLKVVAEGIETQAELDFLVEHGCDEIQGYLFSRPLPTKDFEKLLFSHKHLSLADMQMNPA